MSEHYKPPQDHSYHQHTHVVVQNSQSNPLGMIGFVVMQSLTDIYGHGADASTIGGWFDRISDAHIMDQRAFWVFVLLLLVIKGAGPLSLDRVLANRAQQTSVA